MATELMTRTTPEPPAPAVVPASETYELSLRNPAKSLRELTRRLGTSSSDKDVGPAERRRRSAEMTMADADADDDGSPGDGASPPPPVTATSALQRWNKPIGNAWRLGFCFWSFMIAGMNDASVGALIPYLQSYYDVSTTIVSLIFLTPFAGYAAAAFVNSTIHMHFGQRGCAIAAPLFHIATYAVLCAHPPWPVVVVINALSGFGNDLTDACFCAWVGGQLANPNAVQGLLHASYSVGALIAPLVATAMVATYGLPWYTWYYIMLGASFVELVGLTAVFWRRTAAVYRREHPDETSNGAEKSGGGRTREALQSKVTWIAIVFFFTYMGVEVGLGGWVVSFMLNVRHATEFQSGASGTGFWAGMAAGRAGLGFVTERYGERRCVAIYLACAVALQLVFWLVPQFVVSAVAVALLGFFLGPMFPGGVMVATRLLPKHLHVSAIGFAMALGGIGGTVFPFAIGAIADAKGVWVLQPIILALIVVLIGVWLCFPRIKKRE